MLANRFAHLTNVKLDFGQDMMAFADGSRGLIQARPSLLEFTGVAPATPEVMQYLHQFLGMETPQSLPFERSEWMCLYCATPNKKEKIHCSQCGAARNWLL